MFVYRIIWGKWQGVLDEYNYEITLRVSVIKGDGKELTIKNSIENIFIMFPPSKDLPRSYAIEVFMRFMGVEEKSSLSRWVDYWTPILIEEGIKKGLWDE
jgi:hypothetical protein